MEDALRALAQREPFEDYAGVSLGSVRDEATKRPMKTYDGFLAVVDVWASSS